MVIVCFLLGNSMVSAYRCRGNYPEKSIQHSEHGESLKSRIIDGYLYFRVILCLTLQGSFFFFFFFFFFCWHYNPLRVLAFSVIFFHSVLSLLSFLHPLIPIIRISSSTSSIHLFLGLPLILLPIGFHSNILLGILPPSIHITCPSQAILLLFINLTMSALPMSSFSSWFFLILQILFSSCTGPKILQGSLP